MELASLVWDSYSWTHYLLYFVCQFHTKSCLDGVKPSVLDQNDEFWYGVGTQSVVNNGSNCMNPIPVMPIPYQRGLRGNVTDLNAGVCVFQHLAVLGMGFVHETILIMSPNV